MQETFKARLQARAEQVESVLEHLLTDSPQPLEAIRLPLLMDALRYVVLGGGKRLRPCLTIETAALLGVHGMGPVRAGAAVELVHCYSLVHDDLPAMDNDALRRGKPTLHVVHDDALAILAGDALLTLAFDILVDEATTADPRAQAALVRELARGAGLGGMVGGQLLDLTAEGRYPEARRLPDDQAIMLIQSMKTGALIRAACRMGAVLGGADAKTLAAIDAYAQALGLAFQIRDDLLDVESDVASLGKAVGKDAAAGKATFVSLLGVEGARRRLTDVTEEGRAAVSVFGNAAGFLLALLDFNRERQS